MKIPAFIECRDFYCWSVPNKIKRESRFWRHLSWDYVARFYWFNNTVCRPVRAIIRRDYPEDGEWSPRNNIITSGLNRYIKRQWDTDNSWRQGEFRKENFGTK